MRNIVVKIEITMDDEGTVDSAVFRADCVNTIALPTVVTGILERAKIDLMKVFQLQKEEI